MIAVIFEVYPADGQMKDYLDTAAKMLPELEKIDGFISVERFQSLTEPTKMLSLSFFESEEAVQSWRVLSAHRTAQTKGRNGVFDDYRLRIAAVIRDYGMDNREQAPLDSRNAHEKPK